MGAVWTDCATDVVEEDKTGGAPNKFRKDLGSLFVSVSVMEDPRFFLGEDRGLLVLLGAILLVLVPVLRRGLEVGLLAVALLVPLETVRREGDLAPFLRRACRACKLLDEDWFMLLAEVLRPWR